MIEFTIVNGKSHAKVTLFALSTCGWCKRTKKYLEDAGVAYSYIDVDKLHGDERKEALEMMRKHDPTESFPTIVIGDDCVVGFDKRKLDKLLGA